MVYRQDRRNKIKEFKNPKPAKPPKEPKPITSKHDSRQISSATRFKADRLFTTSQKILLHALKSYDMQREDLAKLLGVSLHTLKAWLLPILSPAHRNMPPQMLELLAYKLQGFEQHFSKSQKIRVVVDTPSDPITDEQKDAAKPIRPRRYK